MFRIPDENQQQLFHSLTRHPGWHELKQAVAAAREREFTGFANKLYTNGPDDKTLKAIRSSRDFFRGINWLLNRADFSAAAFERAHKQDGDNA